MTLPVMTTPEYSCTIPSTGQQIKYRPFLVKEEKILLMAQEGGDKAGQITAVAQILAACILTDGIEIAKLATFDIEYLFMKLRAKSVGELVELSLGHTDTEGECKHRTKVSVNIDNIEITDTKIETKIMLTDELGVVMKYPTFQDVAVVGDDDATIMFKTIINCIDYVFDQETVYNDFTRDEMETWTEGLNQQQFSKLIDFLKNLPQLTKKIEWACSECNQKDELVLQGLSSFF
jgi:hypothetical protein